MAKFKNLVSTLMQSQVVPVFAPTSILTAVTQVLSSAGYLAVRSPADFSYRINGAGSYVTVPAGTILGVNDRITSIDFQSAVALLEVM
jgi:hypothetical protein